MRTLHTYLLRQAVSTLVMTVCVFAFVMLLGNVLKEILALLVNGQVSATIIFKAILLLFPWIMAYVLPFALLAAMLLLFGRLSADNELTAVKASGISLLSLIMPLMVLAIAVSALCAWFNLKITPESRVAYKRILLQPLLQSADSLITDERIIDEIPGVVLYVRKKKGDLLEDVVLYKKDEAGNITERISAGSGRVIFDRARNTIAFTFKDAIGETLYWEYVDIREPSATLPATNIFSANPLSTVLSNSIPGRVFARSRIPHWVSGHMGGVDIAPIDLRKMVPSEGGPKITEMTFAQLKEELYKRRDTGISISPVLVQMHRQVAFSFASFAFTLIAIPLGIRAHRRETSIGMAISLVLVLIYYGFLILSQALNNRENLHPHLLVWIPNLLFQTLGAFLLWRANKQR